MECLNCECEKTSVLVTIKYAGTLYRERQCPACDYKYWTEELEVTDRAIIRDAMAFKQMQYRDRKKSNRYEVNKATTITWLNEKKFDKDYFLKKPCLSYYMEFIGWCKLSNIEPDVITDKMPFYHVIDQYYDFDKDKKRKRGMLFFKMKDVGGCDD